MSTMTVSAGAASGGAADRASARAAAAAVRARCRWPDARRGAAHPARPAAAHRLALLALVAAAVLLSGGAAGPGRHRPGSGRGRRAGHRPPGRDAVADRRARGAGQPTRARRWQRILDLNGLQTAEVQAGTALLLP